MRNYTELKSEIKNILLKGTVIPAHPLSLTENRKLNEKGQRALTRYYLAAGVGGIAVGVHTTEFLIHDPKIGLFEPVLNITKEEIVKANLNRPIVKIAGICGPTVQAIHEAELAVKLGYDLGLLSNGGLDNLSEKDLLKRTEEIAKIIPVFGFYLQPAVGGRKLSYNFWREFVEIPNVSAIKIAPFNRYQTLDVVRAVCNSSRHDKIALYTGNDDNIVMDLLTTYRFNVNGKFIEKSIVGGLLGQWTIWTKKAVEIFNKIKFAKLSNDKTLYPELITYGAAITDANSAIFDAVNNFKGAIPGIKEVLRRQGILEGIWCLDPSEVLSLEQEDEIERVYNSYPFLNDDDFVKEYLNKELSG